MSWTIVAVQYTTLDEFPYFHLFFARGIIAFGQNKNGKITQVNAELCTHYLSVPYDICKGNGLIKWKTTPKNGLSRVKGRSIISSASG